MELKKNIIDINNVSLPKLKKTNRIPENNMVEVLSNYSGEQFEMFIFEWLRFCKNELDENSLLFKIGGTGDKGVDIYYKNHDETIYYQAKQYNHQLSPNEVIDIVTKIFWYVNKGELDNPSKIFIVSSKGINSKTVKLFKDFNNLFQEINNQLEKSLKRNDINFSKDEIESFRLKLNIDDCKNIHNILVDEIVYDYYKSEFGSVRFYKQEPFRYRVLIKKDDYNDEVFVKQIKKIYPKSTRVISDAKDNYYSCLCLKETDKYLFGNNEEFDFAKEDVYQGVNMLFYNNENVTDTYVKCLDKATQTYINSSVLGNSGLNIVNNSDKKGICHYLVNEGKLSWEQSDE